MPKPRGKNSFADDIRRTIHHAPAPEALNNTGLQRFSATDQQWIRDELLQQLKLQQRQYESQIRQRDEKVAQLSEDLKRAARAAEK